MINNNIIQSLGAGSGIDTQSLVSQLTEIERAAPQGRIDSKRDLAETQISDFGILSSALSTLQDAAKTLTDPEGLFSKSASFTDSDAVVPTTLDTNVPAGSYAFTVAQVAQSQSLGFAGFNDPTDAVGEGTLTFNFGSWARDVGGDINGAFTQDSTKSPVSIEINSSNNSLNGLRDAINDQDFGVTASVVFDGSEYRLSLLADSGEQNQLEITVEEANDPASNTDGNDLSRFAFNDGVTDFEDLESQAGQDAILTVNGLTVTRDTNTVDDIVEGLTIDLLKATDVGETVTVTVSEDKSFGEQNVRAFVEAYNLFMETLQPILGTSEVEDEEGNKQTVTGSLANDGLAKSTLSQIRNLVSATIPGLAEEDSELQSLAYLGIFTELDGTLTISEEEFTEAFDIYYDDIQKLFAPNTATSSPDVSVHSFKDTTAAGEYSVVVTTAPTRGSYEGDSVDVGVSFPLTISDSSYNFVAEVNGIESGTITLAQNTYNSETDLAAAIQSAINADSELADNGATVAVSFNEVSGGFDITSTQYGTSSTVELSAPSANAINLGLTEKSGTTGINAAGTINGVAAFGSSNVLLPALGEDGEGLALIIDEDVTLDEAMTINFSRGFAGELESLVDSFLSSTGPIAERELTLSNSLEALDDDQKDLDRKMSSYEERLIQQYINMESIINSLNSSSSFLDNLINTLPFTAGDN